MKNLLTLVAVVGLTSATATAGVAYDYEASYGWEDGGTILGWYGNLGSADNVADPLGANNAVLALTENPVGGTPQGFVGWVTGLEEGDTVYASFMGLGHNDLGFASIRIWGHYTTAGGTIDDYDGAGGGNSSYSGAEWTLLDHTWTFDSDGGNNGGLVIEARMYVGGDETTGYVDDLFIGVNAAHDGVEIHTPATIIPAPSVLALLGIAGLARRRRK